MATASKRELSHDRLQELENADSRDRYIDLCIEAFQENLYGEIPKGSDPVAVYGGRWDTVTREYSGDAKRSIKLQVHPGETEVFTWWCSWLDEHIEVRRLIKAGTIPDRAIAEVYNDNEPIGSVLICGGRRWGKSWFACFQMISYALAIPGSRVVAVSPTQKEATELYNFLAKDMTTSIWREWRASDHTFELVNGSVIELKTGNRRHLKIGAMDLLVLNEAQQITQQIASDGMTSLADTVGLAVATANPPRDLKGWWVREWFDDIQDGQRPDSIAFHGDARTNPHVSRKFLERERRRLGARQFRREIVGDMLTPLSDIVFEEFDEAINLLHYIPLEWTDITPEITRGYFGFEADWIVGMDFDKGNCHWCAGRFYLPPGTLQADAVFVIEYDMSRLVNEVVQEKSLHAFKSRTGYPIFFPERTVLIADASGSFQDAKHSKNKAENPPSWSVFIDNGWHVLPPDCQEKRNPHRVERFGLANQLLRRFEDNGGYIGPSVYVLPTAADTLESLRVCPALKDGTPVRTKNPHSHLADCWTYITWHRWGRDPTWVPTTTTKGKNQVTTWKRRSHSI